VAALFVAACVTASFAVVGSMLVPGRDELTDAVDKLAFPSELTMVDENSTGNRLCLEECVVLSRTYGSTLTGKATVEIAVAALEQAGYRCIDPSGTAEDRDWCGSLDVDALSYWQRATGGFVISLVVHRIPSTWAATDLSNVRVDPLWRSYAIVRLPE